MKLPEVISELKKMEEKYRELRYNVEADALDIAVSYLEPIYNGGFTTDSDEVIADMGMVTG